jgi:hypothetical protein
MTRPEAGGTLPRRDREKPPATMTVDQRESAEPVSEMTVTIPLISG